jgi:AbrB family looped-hinge helix DNA binding protein
MTTTIDKAGRVVIPAAVRQRLGLRPGTPLAISSDDVSIRLEPVVSPPKLVRLKNGLLVARPTVPVSELPKIDVAALIEEERDRWPY